MTKLFLKPATFYSPRQLPAKYHRRWRTLLLCSVWEQVWLLRHHHWISCFEENFITLVYINFAFAIVSTHSKLHITSTFTS